MLHGRDVPKTAAELDRRAATALDVAMPTAARIGLADATALGRKQYQRGDLHAVVHDLPIGEKNTKVFDITYTRQK